MRYWIDGYNVIFTHPLASEDLQASREWLLGMLRPLAEQAQVVVVFDAPSQIGQAVRQHFGPLEVVFTAEGESADAYILELLEHETHPRSVMVVTGDRRLQRFVCDGGAHTVDPREFLTRLRRADTAREEATRYNTSEQERKRWFQIFHKRIERGEE